MRITPKEHSQQRRRRAAGKISDGRRKLLKLTRRAQVQDALEQQGDPESAGWTSPQTLPHRCPILIHSSGSVLHPYSLFTSKSEQNLKKDWRVQLLFCPPACSLLDPTQAPGSKTIQ
ncbi:hypothetical protein AMECASPLE_007123 [Ameca splendens]|uniref:Uncharacterized protein n=1 Tax=Ameca splendens TaxID=208324 RepID=A0ABV0XCP2_9TELE